MEIILKSEAFNKLKEQYPNLGSVSKNYFFSVDFVLKITGRFTIKINYSNPFNLSSLKTVCFEDVEFCNKPGGYTYFYCKRCKGYADSVCGFHRSGCSENFVSFTIPMFNKSIISKIVDLFDDQFKNK